jgi:transposase InsO family protein
MEVDGNKTLPAKRGRKPKINFADIQYENRIQESENKLVNQYEKRQQKQKRKDEAWKQKRDEIGEEKFKQIVAEQFRPANKPKRYRRVLSFKINDIWAGDLVEFQDETIIKANDGYKYILFVVDLYSRYAFGRAMKNKTSVETLTAFKQIMTEAGAKPKKLWRDLGKEFYGDVGKYLKEQKIEAYSTYGTHKANVVERFNRTMKNNMYKMFLYNNNYGWTNHLQELIDKYNNSPHRGIQNIYTVSNIS